MRNSLVDLFPLEEKEALQFFSVMVVSTAVGGDSQQPSLLFSPITNSLLGVESNFFRNFWPQNSKYQSESCSLLAVLGVPFAQKAVHNLLHINYSPIYHLLQIFSTVGITLPRVKRQPMFAGELSCSLLNQTHESI